MKKGVFLGFGLILLFGLVSANLFAQSASAGIRDLGEALSSGNVTLTTANGRGVSSGAAVEGSLRNNTLNEIRINVIINNGLYLSNSNSDRGQNMVAVQVFRSNLGYSQIGSNRFISLPANSETSISFYAFCANFELDNPSSTDRFSRSSMPSDIQSTVSRISRYVADYFDDSLTAAVQIALWRSQGLSRAVIATEFTVTDADWTLSTSIMNY